MDVNKLEPAFPRDHRYQGHNGMTLRDYAAIHADFPWNAVMETLRLKGEPTPTIRRLAEYRAEVVYLQADAMLAARGE